MMEDWKKYKRASHVLVQGEVPFDKKKLKAEYITFNRTKLRTRLINADLFEGTDHAWVINTPYDVRDETMIDVLKAYDSNFVKLRKTRRAARRKTLWVALGMMHQRGCKPRFSAD